MKRSDEKRIRASLQVERMRLTDDRRRFESEVRAWGRERAEVLEVVALLTSRFGTANYEPSDNLGDVLRECLLAPLLARDNQQARLLAEAQERIRRLLIQVERAPSRPVELPAPPAGPAAVPGHQTSTEAVARSGPPGYRAVCSCGWKNAVIRASANGARKAELEHLQDSRSRSKYA